MRKFLILAMLGGVMLLAACDHLRGINHGDNYDVANDSVRIAELFENLSTPQFATVNEAVEYRNNVVLQDSIDAIFMALPEDVLINVASVLMKKNFATITKKDIVDEYARCRNVYDNLPTKAESKSTANAQSVDLAATDLGDKPKDSVISTSYSFRTDTINGKPVRVKIKTEKSYE